MIIGITGLIGSGKSTATDYFVSKGFLLVDADIIGKEVVESNKSLLKKLVSEFGKEIVTPTYKLRRKKLAELAFKDKQSTEKLNKLVHPYLLKEINTQIKRAKSRNIVIDAALLIYWGLHKKIDFTLLVHASLEDRIKRMKKRGYSEQQVKQITKRQLPYRILQKRADRTILNNRSAKDFIRKLDNFYQQLMS
ncbi:MAG: dephospho-CoA kinase [Calditrichaeota bacterium]|nr:MAG: dephospho-CoA kinase [Calditrichota bacterium]